MASLVLNGDVELQRTMESLMSEGTRGGAIIRKGLRAGAKVVADHLKSTFPRKSGKAAGSVKVRAMARKKGRIGVRVSLFAESAKGFPYPLALEHGAKNQPKSGRIRKVNGRAYDKLTWHIEPQHNVEKAFKASAGAAEAAVVATMQDELEKARP